MLITQVHNLLSEHDLARVLELTREAQFVDGKISGGDAYDKNNREMYPESDRYLEIRNILDGAIRGSVEFNLTAFPRSVTQPIISRYEDGMYYGDHVDLPVMGFVPAQHGRGRSRVPIGSNYVRSDLSMTLFLTEPDTYEGGELTFEGPFGPVKAKLPAGSGILYPTGTRHSVAAVTRGARLAAIFWVQTLFPVEAERLAVCQARQLMTEITSKLPDSGTAHLAEESFYNLCRIFAEV